VAQDPDEPSPVESNITITETQNNTYEQAESSGCSC